MLTSSKEERDLASYNLGAPVILPPSTEKE
jgi:hypothetical protein